MKARQLLQIPLKIKTDKALLPVIAGSVFFLLSAFVWWLSTPLQWKITGLAIPLSGEPLSPQGFTKSLKLVSFGTISLSLFSTSILFYTIKSLRKLLFFVGLFGIVLSVYFPLKFIFIEPNSLNTILYQQGQYNNIIQFSELFLVDTNIAQSLPGEAGFSYIADKITYCFQFISIGFYTNLMGGILLLTASLRFFINGYKKILIISSMLVSLILTVVLYGHIMASEFYVIEADKQLFSGFPGKAIEFYMKAKTLNPNLDKSDEYIYKLGYANYLIRNNSSIVHFFQGRNYQHIGSFRESLNEYNTAQDDKSLKDVVSKRKANLFISEGLASYGKNENYSAISMFTDATSVDPWQIQSHFFLSKAYLDINRHNQQPSYSESVTILALCGEKLIRADTYNMLGDSYYKSRRFTDAREMYYHSRKSYNYVKKVINFNGLKGMQGL